MFGLIFFVFVFEFVHLQGYKLVYRFKGKGDIPENGNSVIRRWKVGGSFVVRVIVSGASQENNNAAFTQTPRGNVFWFGTNVDQTPRFTLKTLKR